MQVKDTAKHIVMLLVSFTLKFNKLINVRLQNTVITTHEKKKVLPQVILVGTTLD